MQTFKIRFEFSSTKAYGDIQIRFMEVKAKTAKEAENIAWRERHSYWGAYATDNAIDCKVVY